MHSASGLAFSLVSAGLLSAWAPSSEAAPGGDGADKTPVVVELFSSEGCSSCPPADTYLNELDTAQPVDGVTVIALEFHVDYWDDIGWKDPFSSHQFTERQYAYAQVLADRHVYTPELVVQGRFPIAPGQGPARLQRAALEPVAHVHLTRKGTAVHVSASDIPPSNDALEVWLAITERGLRTHVTSGENRGRTLVHAPVVRRLIRLGTVSGKTYSQDVRLRLDPEWDAQHVGVVTLLQERGSRRIVGAGAG